MIHKKSSENLEFCQLQKMELVRVKTTTYLTGTIKNRFLNDCVKCEFLESELARNIIKFYYAYLDANNIKTNYNFNEIYKTLNNGNNK